MRHLVPLALLATLACQPQAPRLALERAVYKRTVNQSTSTREFTYSYGDGPLIGGQPLDRGELRVSQSGTSDVDRASIDYTYSEERLLRYDQRSDNDSLDSVGQFLYRPGGRFQKLETDNGPGGAVEINIEATYDADDRALIMLVYSWRWWLFRVNERADVHYFDDGRIRDLDGNDLFIRFEWGDEGLRRVEVQSESGDDQDYRLSYQDGRLHEVVDGDDRWSLSYDGEGRIARIDARLGSAEESAEYSYRDHSIQGVRIAPRLPLYVNFLFGLDGRGLHDLDLLALPDYFE